MQRVPEGFQRSIEARLQIRRKVRLVLIINDLRIVRENPMKNLLCFQGIQDRFQGIIHRQ